MRGVPDAARGDERAGEEDLAHLLGVRAIADVEDLELGRRAIAGEVAVVAVGARLGGPVRGDAAGVRGIRPPARIGHRDVDERTVTVDEELPRRAVERRLRDLVRARGRPAVDDAQDAVLREVDVLAVVLDEVGLVDARDLVVGAGARGRAVGRVARGRRRRRDAARRGPAVRGVALEPVRAALAAIERRELLIDLRVHARERHLPHEVDRVAAGGERQQRRARASRRRGGRARGGGEEAAGEDRAQDRRDEWTGHRELLWECPRSRRVPTARRRIRSRVAAPARAFPGARRGILRSARGRPREAIDPAEDLVVPALRVLRLQHPVVLVGEVEEA